MLKILFNFISLLIHSRPEKLDVVDTARTLDLMIVTELWEDGLDLASIAHLLCGKGLEALDGPGPVCIFMDVSISRDHGVMGGKGKLCTGTKEGDGAVSATIEDRSGVRREPRSPSRIRERASLWVKIAHGIVGPSGSLRILPSVLAIEQDRYPLLRGGMGFF